MSLVSLDQFRDNALRMVSNNLHLRLEDTRRRKRELEAEHRDVLEQELEIERDIDRIQKVRNWSV